MASNRLTFLLDGRDHLSRVLDRAGDHADRLGRRLLAASINGDAAMRRLSTTTTTRMAGLRRDTDLGEKALKELKGTLISLAPAAIPAAASLAPIAAGAGAAAVAVAAFGAALGPQIAGLTAAGEAEKKWQTAIEDGGESSQAAVDAQLDYQKALMKLPPASQRAALALSSLKDEYKGWSDALAADTMPVFTKGLAIAGALLPKTTGLVKGASVQLDRMMTIVAGGMSSPGLDQLNKKFTAFATGTLQRVNDQLVRLMRTTDTGKISGGLSQFMDYARAQGPVVADTLRNVGTALINVLRAGSDVGVSMLDLVNALSGIVAAVPPGAIAAVLQLALAIKAVKLAAVGMSAASTAMATLGTQLVAMRVAAAAAPGRLSAVTAAIGAMSRGAKLAVAGTGIGLLLIALTQLSQRGKQTPPDVDKLTSSLGRLGQTGKITGEAARVMGTDLSALSKSLGTVSDPSITQGIEKWVSDLLGYGDGGPAIKAASQNISAIDKALAGLVQGGKADLAAAALDKITKGLPPAKAAELKAGLDGYKDALANAKFEAQLAAQAMGLFGSQAQAVQTKLDAQKASADGLTQSINAMSNAALTARGGIRGMEAALDSADKAFKKNGKTLDENTAKGRGNNQALDDIAASTIKAAEGARANGASWATVNKIYDRGHAKILKLTQGVTGNEAAAKRLADQILRTPNKTARIKGNLEDLQSKLATAKSKLGAVPDSRKAKVRADIADLQAKIRQAKAALDAMNGRTATTYLKTVYSPPGHNGPGGIPMHAKGTPSAAPGYAWVGEEGPELVRFRGGERVYDHRTSTRMTSGSGGSMVGAGQDAGRGLMAGLGSAAPGVESAARRMAAAVTAGIRGELQIASPSKKTKALAADAGKGLIVGLTGSRAKIKSVAKDLAKDIWAAFSGSKDNRLVAMVTRETKKLLDAAAKRDSIAATIKRAKDFAETTRVGAKQSASLGGMFESDEQVTAAGISSKLQQRLAKMKTFSGYIKTLAKRGLNKTMLREILTMGPEEGYAYASALVGANSKLFKEINATQYKINDQAESLGRSGADALYDSGKDAGKGFLKGLESQQDAIEKQMLKIAKGMQKAIKKALGIKSPSTVMAQLGRYSTEGLAAGLTDRMPVLDRALATVTDRVASVQPVIGRPAVAGGGAGSTVINLNIDVRPGGVADWEEIRRGLLSLKRTHGTTVNLGIG